MLPLGEPVDYGSHPVTGLAGRGLLLRRRRGIGVNRFPPREREKPVPPASARPRVAEQVHRDADQPCLGAVRQRTPAIQPDERFLREIRGELGLARQTVEAG